MIDDAEVIGHTHVIARRLREDEGAATSAVTDEILARIIGLDEDPVLVDMLDASVHGNVTTIIHMLANDIAIDRLQPTTAAVEYARRLAQRDVPANSLVRAYHVGQSVLLRDVYTKVDELQLAAGDAMQVVRHVTDIVYEYIDWITKYVFEAYEDERRRWMGVESNVLTSTIHALLSSPSPDPTLLERESSYRLDQRHCALILWSSDDDDVTVRDLDRAARSLAVRLRSDGDPLVTTIDRQTVWTWIPLGRRGRLLAGADVEAALGAGSLVRVAHGSPGDGVDGFRRSHQQAQAAFTVATMSSGKTAEQVVGYRDRGVGLVSMLSRDVDATRAWVHDVLGPLAADGDAAMILRDTLSVYFATGDSHLRAAERLNVHRNTVKYRVTKALAETPVSDRLDLATAITVCDLLGSAVIGDAAP